MQSVYESLPGNRGEAPAVNGGRRILGINRPRTPRERVSRTTNGFVQRLKNVVDYGFPPQNRVPMNKARQIAASMGIPMGLAKR